MTSTLNKTISNNSINFLPVNIAPNNLSLMKYKNMNKIVNPKPNIANIVN